MRISASGTAVTTRFGQGHRNQSRVRPANASEQRMMQVALASRGLSAGNEFTEFSHKIISAVSEELPALQSLSAATDSFREEHAAQVGRHLTVTLLDFPNPEVQNAAFGVFIGLLKAQFDPRINSFVSPVVQKNGLNQRIVMFQHSPTQIIQSLLIERP